MNRKTTMLNFRVRDEFAEAVDQAARAAGLSRSKFMRQAVMKEVVAWNGHSPQADPEEVPKALQGQSRIVSKTQMMQANKTPVKDGGCSHPRDKTQRLPTGIRICLLCNTKLR
jgi:predicted transcriptional regulator